MDEKIKDIFKSNIRLIERTDKAIYYFRCQEYDKALGFIADSMEGINKLVMGIVEEIEYFAEVEEHSVTSMIEGILAAKKNGDYILLADILELQLGSFISQIQEHIIRKEPFPYSMAIYEKNLVYLEGIDEELYSRLRKPEEPKKLLDKGYAIEYSACGLMTMAGMENKHKFYFHSNSHIIQEAFLLAKSWADQETEVYHIYGMGLGYHIAELMKLCPDSEIYVYESSFDVIRLTCNFVDLQLVLESENVHLVFDETLEVLRQAEVRIRENFMESTGRKERLFVHYPSYRNLKEEKEFLEPYLPWLKVLEDCR